MIDFGINSLVVSKLNLVLLSNWLFRLAYTYYMRADVYGDMPESNKTKVSCFLLHIKMSDLIDSDIYMCRREVLVIFSRTGKMERGVDTKGEGNI